MTNIVVFDTRLAPQVEKIIEDAVNKAAGDYVTVSCVHGSSPTSPSYVATHDYVEGGFLRHLREIALDVMHEVTSTPRYLTPDQEEFVRLDNQCRWGVATTQERQKRDAMLARGLTRPKGK